MLSRIVTVVALSVVYLAGPVAGQELTLPRQELDDAIRAGKDALVQELTEEHKTVKKAIAAGGKGYGNSRKEAIVNARKKLAEVEAALDAAKKARPMPELDIDKLAVGQIGKLYRNQSVSSPMVLPNPGAPGGYSRVVRTIVSKESVEVRIIEIIDARAALVTYGDKAIWLRMATAGLTTGQKLTLDKPVKVVGTKAYQSEAGPATVFELAFFAASTP